MGWLLLWGAGGGGFSRSGQENHLGKPETGSFN